MIMNTAMTNVEYISGSKPTKDTPYLLCVLEKIDSRYNNRPALYIAKLNPVINPKPVTKSTFIVCLMIKH